MLASLLPYGPAIAEHVALCARMDPNAKLSPDGGGDGDGMLLALLPAIRQLEAWFLGLESGPPPGYISVGVAGSKGGKQNAAAPPTAPVEYGVAAVSATAAPAPVEVYQDFYPLLLRQAAGGKHSEFPTFDDALAEFFSKIEVQRSAVARSDAERAAVAKLDRIRSDQGGRLGQLQRDADEAELRGSLIEYNLEAVDAAIGAVNEALASGAQRAEQDIWGGGACRMGRSCRVRSVPNKTFLGGGVPNGALASGAQRAEREARERDCACEEGGAERGIGRSEERPSLQLQVPGILRTLRKTNGGWVGM
eukprot:359188-Chlamydomonas_euryale.AAC.1